MTEDVAIALVGKGIHTFLICFGEEIKEILNVGMMHERAIFFCAEKLSEVKSYILIGIVTHKSAEVVGVDIQTRQTCVWIMVAGVVNIPLGFGALLHHIIPRVDFVLIIVVKQIERSA